MSIFGGVIHPGNPLSTFFKWPWKLLLPHGLASQPCVKMVTGSQGNAGDVSRWTKTWIFTHALKNGGKHRTRLFKGLAEMTVFTTDLPFFRMMKLRDWSLGMMKYIFAHLPDSFPKFKHKSIVPSTRPAWDGESFVMNPRIPDNVGWITDQPHLFCKYYFLSFPRNFHPSKEIPLA